MIEDISMFFDRKKSLGIAIILLLLFILYMLFYKDSEHMNQTAIQILPKCTMNEDQYFNAQYIQRSKILNFKCNVKGIDYYLACVRMLDYNIENQNKTPDCVQSMLILIPATEIQSMLDSYIKDMQTAEKICNASLKIKCDGASTPNEHLSESEHLSECPNFYEVCKQTRLFLHDFNVVDVTPPNSDQMSLRKYIIKGTAIPSIDGKSLPTMFNTFLLNEHGINMICGDTYAYGSPNIPKQYAEIIIIEKNGSTEDTSNLRVKIRFNALQQLVGNKNGQPKRTNIIDQCTGQPKTKPVYMGVCDSTRSVKKGSNTYLRLCVYDDIMDQNVLEFEPAIVEI